MDKQLQHEILSVFIKLYETLGYIPTRDEFVQHTGLTQKAIVVGFGSYTALVNASGLAPKRIVKTYGERIYEKENIKFEGITKVFDKFTEEIKPYHGKFDIKHPEQMLGVVYTDSHSQFRDEFTWIVFLSFIREAQPSLIILGGDILEFYRISFHNKSATRALDIQDEIDFVVEQLKKIRELCPNAQIDYHMGNHEFRLFRYLCEESPALLTLRSLQFNQLLQLDDLRINLVARENAIFKPTKDKENYKVYNDKWMFTHGTDIGVFPAQKELQQYGISGASGHVHRHTFQSRRNIHGYHTWMTLPTAAANEVGREYMPNMINWDQGFGIMHFHKYGVTQQVVITTNGFACIGGKFYYKNE